MMSTVRVGFNQQRLEHLLQNVEQGIEVERYLREMSRMRIPETVARNTRLIERIRPYSSSPSSSASIATIIRKNEKRIDENRSRRAKFAERKAERMKVTQAALALAESPHNQLTGGHMQMNVPRSVASELSIEIPPTHPGRHIENNDLLMKVPTVTSQDRNAYWGRIRQKIGQFFALNYGPGLQSSEGSAFLTVPQRFPDLPQGMTRDEYLVALRRAILDTPPEEFLSVETTSTLLEEMNHVLFAPIPAMGLGVPLFLRYPDPDDAPLPPPSNPSQH